MTSHRDEMNHLFSRLLIFLFLINGGISYAQSPTAPFICLDTSQRLLFREDTVAVVANFIAKTNDGNFLIPGYCYPDNAIAYYTPYLVKSTPEGNILWSKRYNSLGTYPSKWYSATKIKELKSGDLLMTGQIVVPGTDDRRELAIWRLDKNGNLLWATSYESSIWTNPITGATEITGIEEDDAGNIFLSGALKIFEAPKFAFVLKLDQKGNILWDNNYSSNSAFAFGVLFLQNKLLLIGSIGPLDLRGSLNTSVLWCLQLDPASGETLNTKGWYADYDQQSAANSFAYANTAVSVLDNGQISVHGTAHSDFLGLFIVKVDTINHSIIANFSPDFIFQNGIMLSSMHGSDYYNTVATQYANGRISYTRFKENNNLYNEDIIYGSIQNNQVIDEKIYHEKNRSSQFASNFLFYSPDENIVIQTYFDTTIAKGGLEMLRFHDRDSSNLCNGNDTSLTFIQPYFMKEADVPFDSIVNNAFRPTNHNFVRADAGSMIISTGCTLAGVNAHGIPIFSLDKDSVLCKGSTRELTTGKGYAQYSWSNGSTSPSISVSDTGRYWVSVTNQDGCTGSDTTYIATIASVPSNFLPNDTTICEFAKLTIQTSYSYQSYLWNDQSTAPSRTISDPGLYQLQVTDSNHCVGSDSMKLTKKQCLEGFYMPNAFTPNGDGRNDVFRPLLFGNITHFRFAVYNRWGEKIFETHTAGEGWDGKLNGVPVASGAFVWFSQYQLEGQAEKTKTGTVLVIR